MMQRHTSDSDAVYFIEHPSYRYCAIQYLHGAGGFSALKSLTLCFDFACTAIPFTSVRASLKCPFVFACFIVRRYLRADDTRFNEVSSCRGYPALRFMAMTGHPSVD